jgi:hypothetical protein
MATMFRYRSVWSGWAGAPGYTNLYATSDLGHQAMADSVHAFLQDFVSATTPGQYLPTGVKIQCDPTVSVLDPANGDAVDELGVTMPVVITGADTLPWSAPSGACIGWKSSQFRKGRRVSGRTFVVPLGGSAYQVDGTLEPAFLSQAQTAINVYLADSAIAQVIWKRPVGVKGQPPTTPGEFVPIIAAAVRDQAAVLRSRRT